MNIVFNSGMFSQPLKEAIEAKLSESRLISNSKLERLDWYMEKNEIGHFKVAVNTGNKYIYDIREDAYEAARNTVKKLEAHLRKHKEEH